MSALIAGDGDPRQALPGCAWALMRGNRIESSGAVGYADLNAHRSLRADSPMRVASISKIATALVVHRLAEANLLSLDDDIARHLGEWARNPAFPDAPIRVRHLLSHTSSMRDGAIYWAHLGERTADFFVPNAAHWEGGAHWASDHPPGAYFTYCNLAFGVLATIAERVSNRRFDQLAHDLVLAPLGLDSGFNWSGSPRAFIARGAPIWLSDERGIWEVSADYPLPTDHAPVFLNPENRDLASYVIGENGTLFSPQGGLRASALDLARIGLMLNREGAPLVSATTFRQMRAPVWASDGTNGDTKNNFWTSYGLGLQIIEPSDVSPIEHQERVLIGHSGDAYGLRGGLFVDPAAGRGFAFLMNGGPPDEARAPGARSGFSRAEERAMQTLYDLAMEA
ncbi:MAG: serine hydrolase domain-containing protein [Hyphomonadaceae bacterium]